MGEAALKIVGVTTEDDGIYTCIAVNDMGSASSSASLRVLGKLHPEPHTLLMWPEIRDKSLGGCTEQASLWDTRGDALGQGRRTVRASAHGH